jgi:hyperosmotically inducible periplasmic protein
MKSVWGLIICLTMVSSIAVLSTGCSGDRYNKSTGEVIDDAVITSKVKTELLADPDVKGLAVKVKTYRGEVQLSGFVDTQAQKNRAAEIARGVKGVQWVKNDIVVK